MIVLFNPTAGRRRASRLWRVLDVLAEHGVRFEVAETHRAGHATELAREACVRAGRRRRRGRGGDGTVAEVAAGLLGSRAKLGIIPLGTANVLAHELGLPGQARDTAAALTFARTRTLWPGLARDAHGGTRLFVQMLGVGFDAQVVQRLSLPMKRRLGRGAYVVQSLRELVRYRFEPVRVRIDGAENDVANAIVCKGRLYGGPYLLAPDAMQGEPGFTVALFAHGGALPAMRYGAALPLNRLSRMPGVRLVRGHEVEIGGDAPAQADGDPAGSTPFSVRDAERPIDVIVG